MPIPYRIEPNAGSFTNQRHAVGVLAAATLTWICTPPTLICKAARCALRRQASLHPCRQDTKNRVRTVFNLSPDVLWRLPVCGMRLLRLQDAAARCETRRDTSHRRPVHGRGTDLHAHGRRRGRTFQCNYIGCSKSKQPVPFSTTLPSTNLADGDLSVSQSPSNVLCVKNCVQVSKLILRNGEALLSIPIRLKGRRDPVAVM